MLDPRWPATKVPARDQNARKRMTAVALLEHTTLAGHRRYGQRLQQSMPKPCNLVTHEATESASVNSKTAR